MGFLQNYTLLIYYSDKNSMGIMVPALQCKTGTWSHLQPPAYGHVAVSSTD